MSNFINTIHQGDCLDVMSKIEESSIDLIYLDPPFFTQKKHKLSSRDRKAEFSFDDIWSCDKEYAEFLYHRVLMMRGLLKDTGSIFIHCDKSGEHIIRAILDNIFGNDNFQSEIIWSYKRWSNSKKGLLPNHQNIYFYSKTKDFKFNLTYTAYSESTNVDQILQRRTRDSHNKAVYDFDEAGNIKLSGSKKGVPLGDVWDIPFLNPKAKERTGYPTQKPLVLLDKIIELVTAEGDIILDPFCGSGTTCVSAKLLNRNFIGIDISNDAVSLCESRINDPIKTSSNVMAKGRESYSSADQEALKLISGMKYQPVHRNKGIDAILIDLYQGAPVLVRIQKQNESINEAMTLLEKAMRIKKSKKSFLIKTQKTDFFDEEVNCKDIIIIESPSLLIEETLERANKKFQRTAFGSR